MQSSQAVTDMNDTCRQPQAAWFWMYKSSFSRVV